MKKIFIALLLAFATTSYTHAQITAPAVEEKADTDVKYQKGAIPVIDGHATLTRTINTAAGLTPEQVMQRLDVWMQRCMRDERVRHNQRLQQPSPLQLHQSVIFELTFSKSFIQHDFAEMSYVIALDASQPGQVTMQMSRINFKYLEAEKNVKYTAEEMISDEVAFTKKGRIIRGYRKFRLKTIDLMDELATSLQTSLQ